MYGPIELAVVLFMGSRRINMGIQQRQSGRREPRVMESQVPDTGQTPPRVMESQVPDTGQTPPRVMESQVPEPEAKPEAHP
jgi:hypothetical protein